MTEKPQWLIDREDERLAKSEPLTDTALVTALQAELEATLDALVPLIQRDQDARAARDTLRQRELGISTLEGIIAEARENSQRLLNTDTRAAVAARQEADAAQAMHDEAVVQFIATKASVDRYDYDGATLAIAELVTRRENITHNLSSPAARAYVLQADADNRAAARDRVLERSVRHSALMLQATDPKRLAEANEAVVRQKTKDAHEAREAAALARAPAERKPSNAAAVALQRIAHGGRVTERVS